MTIAVVVLAVGGALVYVLGTPTSKAPRVRLDSALLATKSAVTADLTLDFKASFDGDSFGVSGTGAVDFATKAASLHTRVFGATIAFIEANGFVYKKLGKLVSTEFPGKTWVRVPVATLNGARDDQLLLTSDPEGMISAFLKLGATVTSIGTTTIDGTQDQGYRIHLTLTDLESHASELPTSIRSLFTTVKTAPKTATMTMSMYIDPAGQLQATHVDVALQATGHPVSVSMDLTMSHFGTASAPAAPPSTETVTYRQLKGSLGSGALTLTSPGEAQST